MSSSKCTALVVVSLGALAMGCGRSPAMPRTPTVMVRVDHPPSAVPCDCEDDDDDDDAAPRRRPPVEYVRLSEWRAPASAERAADEVTPRGPGTPSYLEFPSLTLHEPIPATTFGRSRRAAIR
ncbi:MAG: hypothetical protein KF764_16755 [Labilithrix sp.]|nr:hypothetical protein [Labilithrix sp.]